MRKAKALKYGILISLILLASLTSVMYALAYTVKREVLYTQTFKIEGQKQMFRAFYLSAPAVLFEVKLTVSEGTIKWTPHSAVMFEDTLGWFPCKVGGRLFGTVQRWVCETDNGVVRWSVDPENVNMVWYLNFYNQDQYEKEVYIEVTSVGSTEL
ncbi:hypothetical protein KAS24_04410 [Candidatus Bathyarchaeota archaeon]|nr:hypothetical protein [Candidatus Bathyarchaeota archaeon]